LKLNPKSEAECLAFFRLSFVLQRMGIESDTLSWQLDVGRSLVSFVNGNVKMIHGSANI